MSDEAKRSIKPFMPTQSLQVSSFARGGGVGGSGWGAEVLRPRLRGLAAHWGGLAWHVTWHQLDAAARRVGSGKPNCGG